MVMEPTNFRHRDYPPAASRENGARRGAIHRERQMGRPLVLIGKGAGEDALHMLLVED